MSEIYAQAARLFAERGYAGTNFQDIADAAGFSRQALYHYVSSKDEVFEHLLTDITRSAATELRTINADTELTATAKLHAIAKLIAIHRAEHPHSFLLAVRSEADLPEELATAHQKGKRAALDEIVAAIECGQQSGEFRQVDPRIAALSVLGMLNWVAWWFNPGGRESADAVGQQVADLAIAVVTQPTSTGAAPADPDNAMAAIRDNLAVIEHALKAGTRPAPVPMTPPSTGQRSEDR